MRPTAILVPALAAAIGLAPKPASSQNGGPAAAYASVDPRIGTGEDGHTFPGATVPFGMVQLSPDTQIRPFKQSYKWAAGYRYEDHTILGFSHTHFSGAGHSDLGDFLIQPISGAVRLEPGSPDAPESGYGSRFSHETEVAEPGYYAVTLSDYGVRAELTATVRAGVHRYTFPAGRPAHLLMDLRSSIYNYPGKVLWSRIRVREDGTVTGMRETRGWAPGRQLYFAMRFSQAPTGHELYDREPLPLEYKGFKGPGTRPGDIPAIEGRGLVAVFDFGEPKGPVVVKLALSPVSEANAIANLEAEVPGFDFDAVRASARRVWEKALSVLEIQASPEMRKNVYTALYHALMAPSVAMDVDGSYRGPDNQVHKAEGFTFVSTFSLWDTYRAEQPLMTILQPESRTVDVLRSLVASQQESPFGILPIWQFQGIETWCMIGYHAVPEIADAYLKGIRGFDANKALDAMVASARYGPYGHLADYMKLGYVPVDRDAEGASQTMEYAFDDWAIARMARAMGRTEIAAEFEKRALNWRNVFDSKTGFVRPRLADGSYMEPFDPARAGAGSGFTEGNAWQYSWYQPQDEAGLIRLLGGDDRLVAKLDAMFDAKVDPKRYSDVEDISGMIGQYIHGNEPSHHLAYLYDYAGQPWRTQERLKQVVESQYKPTPEGLVGNDDLGQMSAWLIFTAMGFYPVAPGSNEYVIGRPFVNQATLNLPNGNKFRIVAEHLSEQNRYVERVTLDGQSLARSYIRHEEIMRGGELRFTMGDKANTAWATGANNRPFSMSAAAAQTAAGWKLVWSDEFDGAAGSAPDPARWNYDLGRDKWGNGEMETYTDSPRNVFQDGKGHLVIRAIRDGAGNYTSGRLQTGAPRASTHTADLSWQYGRIEARMKLPLGKGVWPAFWMLGENFASAGWPACGEIDIMENFGTFKNGASSASGTAHGPGYSGGAGIGKSYTLPSGKKLADDYHVFAIEWSQDSIEWFVDGVPYHKITPASLPPGRQWVYNKPFFMLLNLAIGGPRTFLGTPDPNAPFPPQEMLVDYARVYRGGSVSN